MGWLGAIIELANKLVPDKKVSLRQRYAEWLPSYLKNQQELRAAEEKIKREKENNEKKTE